MVAFTMGLIQNMIVVRDPIFAAGARVQREPRVSLFGVVSTMVQSRLGFAEESCNETHQGGIIVLWWIGSFSQRG